MGILIRHFICALPAVLPVALLPKTMVVAAQPAVLVAAVGLPMGEKPGAQTASLAAVAPAAAGASGTDPEPRAALGIGAVPGLDLDDAVHCRHWRSIFSLKNEPERE